MKDNDIKCEHIQTWLFDRKKEDLTVGEQALLNAHIAQCPDCQQETVVCQEIRQWLQTDQVPEPSARLGADFFEMLYAADENKTAELLPIPQKSSFTFKIIKTPHFWLQIAAVLVLTTLGMITGYWLRSQDGGKEIAQNQQIAAMAGQIQQLRQTMMLALLENPSATERLHAVSISAELDHADEQIIDALFTTLNYDKNTNVRLATLEALIRYADNPRVRAGLVQSLVYQESPVVQMALADLMVKLQEKGSVKALRQLLHQKGIRAPVKAKVQQSIIQLS